MSVPGLRLIKEEPTLATNIRAFVADLDASAAYPTGILIANVCKENTLEKSVLLKVSTKVYLDHRT